MAIAFGASIGTGQGTSPDNAWDLTTTGAVPSGGMIVVGVAFFNATATNTVSGGGLTWTQDKTFSLASRNVAIWSAPAPAGLASGSTITTTVTAGSFTVTSAAMYFTGADTVDSSGTGSATSNVWTSSLTTIAADTMIVGFGWQDNIAGGSSTQGLNYTEWCDLVNATDANEISGVYRIVASAAAYTPGGTWSASHEWVSAGVAYKSSAAATTSVSYVQTYGPRRTNQRQGPFGFMENRRNPAVVVAPATVTVKRLPATGVG